MRDRRRVDELTIEELEQVLALRKREERMQRLERMKRTGRVIERETAPPAESTPEPEAAPPAPKLTSPIPAPGGQVAFVDGEPAAPVAMPTRERGERVRKASRRLTNTALLLVEAAAVVGLVFLGWQMFMGIRTLEDRTAEAQTELEEARARTVPTLAPTPVLTLNQVVLPGGHKFVEGQTPSLNVEEIPESVRFAVADQIMRPVISRPPPTEQTALRLILPRLNIDQTIVQGADWEALKQGVGQVLNGYDPGDPSGNVALTAHNDIYGELFKNLDQLNPGDQFQIQTQEQVHLYEITGTEIVAPTDVHVLNSAGKPTAVLISCYPYRVNSKRIVVFADRIG